MIKINLLREEMRKPPSLMWQFWVYIVSVILTIGIVGFLYWNQENTISKLKRENSHLDREIKLYTKYEKLVKQLEAKIAEIERRKAVIKKLGSDRDDVVRFLSLLVVVIPEDKVWLENISYSRRNVKIVGYAKNDETVVDLINNLEATPYIGRDRVNLIRTQTVNYARLHLKRFELTFRFGTFSEILARKTKQR